MAVSGVPYGGSDGRINYNGFNLNADEWGVTVMIGEVKVPGFEGGGFMERWFGLNDCTFFFRAYYNALQPPFGQVGLQVGNVPFPLRLYVSRTAAAFFLFPRWFNKSVPVTTKVTDSVARIEVQGASDGPYTVPTI
jgi:hypothetical protein